MASDHASVNHFAAVYIGEESACRGVVCFAAQLDETAGSRSRALVARASARKARSQPPDLSAMIDFIFRDMKPRPVRVDCRRHAHGLFQPRIVTGGETLERPLTHGLQLTEVIVKRSIPQRTSPLVS